MRFRVRNALHSLSYLIWFFFFFLKWDKNMENSSTRCITLCKIIQEILECHSLTGQKLRQEVTRIVELSRESEFCSCSKASCVNGGCTHCLRRLVVNLLRDNGFNASLCTSQWKRTKNCPGGQSHCFYFYLGYHFCVIFRGC